MKVEIMNITDFQEYIAENIKDHLPEKDRDIEITTAIIGKNNGLQLHGVCIRPSSSIVGPTLYMERYYQEWLDGLRIEDILEKISSIYLNSFDRLSEDTVNMAKHIMEFDSVKDKIIAEVVNNWRNRERLDNLPHTDKEDLSIIYKIMLEGGEEDRATITITNEFLKKWGDINVEDLNELAMDNTKKLCPPMVKSMNEVMREIFSSEGMPEAIAGSLPAEETIYVISNQSKSNGAVSMFFDETLADVAERVDNNLFILPSSIHEVLAVSCAMGTPLELTEMVRSVNSSQVAAEEQLSDHIYFYDRSKQEITIVDEKDLEADLSQYKADFVVEADYIQRGR